LPPGVGQQLANLYNSSIELAGQWRAQIDANPRQDRATRERYVADGIDVREAVEALPSNARVQLLMDDIQQFTAVGMPKWLGMMNAMKNPDDNGALINVVYESAVAPYFAESFVRGLPTAERFADTTNEVATRLGMTFVADSDPNFYWRPAEPGEMAHIQLARQVAADPELMTAYAGERGYASLPESIDVEDLVTWSRGRPPEPAVLERLIQSDAAPIANLRQAQSERIGKGSFSEVFRDGDSVVKVIRDTVGTGDETYALDQAGKEQAAALVYEYSNDLRLAFQNPENTRNLSAVTQRGVVNFDDIVPEFLLDGVSPEAIQRLEAEAAARGAFPDYAPLSHGRVRTQFVDGLTIEQLRELDPEAAVRASDIVQEIVPRAERLIGLEPGYGTGELANGWRIGIDPEVWNFRFNADGQVVAWFDAIVTWPPESMRQSTASVTAVGSPDAPVRSTSAIGGVSAQNVGGRQVGRFTLTGTVAAHADDIISRGPLKGEPTRPYLNSPETIEQIIREGDPVPDPGGIPGALRYDVPGTFRRTDGTWELVIHPDTDMVYHFFFTR
ncbi:MAG: hypothetical protein AAF658_12900, partial [Myxococcota bacterium]